MIKENILAVQRRAYIFDEINFLEKRSIPFELLKGGRIITVVLHPRVFNAQTRILSSKKDIMQKLHSKQQFTKTRYGSDPMLIKQIYGITGILLRVKKAFVNSGGIIRNVVKRYAFEFTFNFQGRLEAGTIIHYQKKKDYRKRRLFFLRRKRARLSEWRFTFVIDDLIEFKKTTGSEK